MTSELELWEGAISGSKSYLVQVLHWFHFRPHALKGSWRHEEVLTWELIRALELLPADCFLGPLLQSFRSTSADVADVADHLLDRLSAVVVTPYPSLRLDGAKRNCRADVGFETSDGAQLWVEVKTGRSAMRDLAGQVRAQSDALRRIASPAPAAVLALLPDGVAAANVTSISWSEVRTVLAAALDRLAMAIPSAELRRGYECVAGELKARIENHPGCLPPNQRLYRAALHAAAEPPTR